MSGFDTEHLHRLVPFSAELDIRVVAAVPDAVRLELDWQARLCMLGAVREGMVSAHATPLHSGRMLIVVETELRNGRGKLVAKTTQTHAVLRA